LIVALVLCYIFANGQQADYVKIKLEKASIEQTANYALWRTDFYICTGIAYAKEIGKTPEDFMSFVIKTHGPTLDGMKGKGLAPVIQLINFVVTNYPNGTFSNHYRERHRGKG
jgi:hypothetical protein